MTDDLTVIFAILGSTHVKAARKTLMKLSPDRILLRSDGWIRLMSDANERISSVWIVDRFRRLIF